jgi:hypothetical protein
MKFCEAMEKLKQGSKITRIPWKDGIYFLMFKDDVRSYQPKLSPYIYNEDIMISNGWLIDDKEEEFAFCDIIPFLLKGAKAKLSAWKDSFIYFDNASKSLVLHSMDMFPFIPAFEAFVAEDWIEIK